MPHSPYALPGVALLIALASCSEPTTEPDKHHQPSGLLLG
jgi:hypothetical protein